MAKASYQLTPLSLQERASHQGFTHWAVITANDLTSTTTSGTQKIKMADLPAGVTIGKMALYPTKGFAVVADATNDGTTVSIGDSGSATRHLGATQVNANNGSVVTGEQLDNTAYGPYAAADEFSATFTPKTGTNLNALNQGEILVVVQIIQLKLLADVKALTASTK